MSLLILEPPYSHLFKDLAKKIHSNNNTFVHLFNLGNLVYLPLKNVYFVNKEIKKFKPRESDLEIIKTVKSLANSNIYRPSQSELELMSSYKQFLENFITIHKISLIICHNDLRWQHAIAKIVAKNMGIRIFFSEEGLFRPHTMTFDPNGVNAFSSVPRDAAFYQNNLFQINPDFISLPNNWRKRFLRLFYFFLFIIINKIGDLFRINIELKNKHYSMTGYLKLFLYKIKIGYKSNINDKSIIKRPYLFIPLQVSTDTQTIIHSTFHGTQEFIDLVQNSYLKLPQQIKDKYILVFKKHPMESHLNYNFHKDAIVSSGPTGALIEGSSLVILINSTTIVESIMKKKQVITLGESHYDIPGITRKAKKNNLDIEIKEALEREADFDSNLSTSFLNFLKYHYQINGNIFYYDEGVLNKLVERIKA